jgi:O-antigen/teichoic acid export membrane protein
MSIARSILSNWTGLFVNGLISFMLTPVLVHGLGDFRYGMWVLAASAIDYLSLLDLGMRATLFRFIARFDAARDRQGLNQTVVTALTISLAIAGVAALLSTLLAVFLPGFFGVEADDAATFRWVLLLLGGSVAATFPAYLLGTYLCARQRFDLYNLASIVTGIARAGLVLIVLRTDGGLLGIAGVTLGVTIFSILLHERLLRRADPGISLDLRLTRWSRARELGSFGAFAYLNGLGDFMRFYTDAVVIGRVLGVAAVTPFSIASRLLYLFRQVIAALASPFMGAMSTLDGQGREKELQDLFLRASSTTATCSLLLVSHLLLNGSGLIRLWVGDRFGAAFPVALVLALGYVVALGQQPTVDIVLVRGQHRLRGLLSVGEGLANIVLSMYWAKQYGLIGVAAGTTVPMLFSHILIQPWYALRVIKLPAGRYFREALARPLMVCALFLGCTWFVTGGRAPVGVLHFAWTVLWETAFFALLTYGFVLTSHERGRLLARLSMFSSRAR